MEKVPERSAVIRKRASGASCICKGRSGTVYCAYEIFNGKMNYIEAIDIVNRLRSPKNMCITIPSQKRFLQYFQYFCKCGKPERKSILIKKIEFIPGLGRKTNLVIIKGIPYEDKPFYKKVRSAK